MQSLQAYVSRSASVLAASPRFQGQADGLASPQGSKSPDQDPKAHSEATATHSPVQDTRSEDSKSVLKCPVEATIFNPTNKTPLHIETKYGVIIKFDCSLVTFSIARSPVPFRTQPTCSSSTTLQPTPEGHVKIDADAITETTSPLAPKYRYRIIPDWQTTYFWYDANWPQNPKDSFQVDFEDIEERYPELCPFYEAWNELYETEFERRGCHLGVKEPAFEEKAESDAWLIEGFLLACWLAFREDIDQVQYVPGNTAYDINVENMGDVFGKFLVNLPDRF
ncbi:hypothetical protein K458DRAFT_417128 [Lentithecium fluviatile CBS 122367]|uniref:Uncharacterized protein n=1 Tax=Lentithecium fluviatile CBS 122367 TaxID=1168545 RepID=A0A6G1J6B0_9PLEO|nr:hypothetical protein K458DRAFT_417128 [Lentithecium fluviatile CBS 122367]